MDNIKVLIVDDEVLIAESLKDILVSFGIKYFLLAHNKAEAIKGLGEFKPDLVLLDIRMEKELDGLEIGSLLSNNFQIPFIYVTAHSDINTIKELVKTKPAGYITKPFKKTELLVNINLAIENIKPKTQLTIKDGYDTILIPFNDIVYIEGEGNYVNIYCTSKKHACRQSLEAISKDLDKELFFKVHRSYIINLQKIKQFTKKNVLVNDISIPIARGILPEFENRMKAKG